MKIGDILTIKPNFYTEYMGANDQPRPDQVVYIHPEGRFYVVEFRSDLGIPGGRRFSHTHGGSRTSWTSPHHICRTKRSYLHENDCDHEQQGRRR